MVTKYHYWLKKDFIFFSSSTSLPSCQISCKLKRNHFYFLSCNSMFKSKQCIHLYGDPHISSFHNSWSPLFCDGFKTLVLWILTILLFWSGQIKGKNIEKSLSSTNFHPFICILNIDVKNLNLSPFCHCLNLWEKIQCIFLWYNFKGSCFIS